MTPNWWSLQDLNRVVTGFTSFASTPIISFVCVKAHSFRHSSFPHKARFAGTPIKSEVTGSKCEVETKIKKQSHIVTPNWWSLQDLNRVVTGFTSFASTPIISFVCVKAHSFRHSSFPHKARFAGTPIKSEVTGSKCEVETKIKKQSHIVTPNWWSLQDLNL